MGYSREKTKAYMNEIWAGLISKWADHIPTDDKGWDSITGDMANLIEKYRAQLTPIELEFMTSVILSYEVFLQKRLKEEKGCC